MSKKFKAGDIVRLKSGGPDMTIKAFTLTQGEAYICQWFAGKKLEQGFFKEDSIELVSPKP
ncbi:YodC family protein [Morganella morganii]|uniref:YodC family protein n=1 Tax=Morganella morganii TaxID=582 RepID=UPI0013977B5D|nr:DUF2158 domain-containing protein [Morganella morganii]MBC3968000.1 DUF2158 domain-containing protein [Morganella morganii]QHW20233.1 DUF2158 domain-containing protein [Morganella morganii]QPJ67575.1 DUF2158 domain-containing protein [Morganella morganii]HCQ8179606.1 DUF2158 domain-containing protein [Morganella morganii]